MKVIRYKVFYFYRTLSLNNSDRHTADTVVALIAIATFMYCTPLITIALKLLGLMELTPVCWAVFGAFAYFNLKFINKKYNREIFEAVQIYMFTDIKLKDKILIAFLTFFSFPYLIITMSLLRSAHFI